MNSLFARLKQWRKPISQVVTLLVILLLLYWVSQNYWRIWLVLTQLGWIQGLLFVLVLTAAYFFSVAAFVALVQSFGYRYSFLDGYHALNLSQIASLLPGGVWGFVSLGSSLWGQSVSKKDSVLILGLNLIFGLSACTLFGAFAVAVTFGWQYGLLCFIPLVGWAVARPALDRVRERIWGNSSPLPPIRAGFIVLGLGLIAWSIESAAFVWLLEFSGDVAVSPFLAASAYAAAYLVGFLIPFTPAGLGVREAVIVLLLAPSWNAETLLAVAVSFRLLQTVAQWLNIGVTLGFRLAAQIPIGK